MTDVRRTPLPRAPLGNPTWEGIAQYLETVTREIYAKFDARNPQSAFADGILANSDGTVTLGTGAIPAGRTVPVSTLVSRITNNGRAADQRFLPMVNAGNRLSVQSTSPLTSTGSASTAQINIAAHTVQFGFGTVSYGSGTITGLTPLTDYYVYASDPEYAGGAVSYAATTDPAVIVGNNDHYFVGGITTANTTPTGNITAITNANPCVVTVPGHPFTSGQSVTFSGVGGMTELNGNTYEITKLDANTFSLVGINSTAYGVFTSGGTATRVSTGTGGTGGSGWDPSMSIP